MKVKTRTRKLGNGKWVVEVRERGIFLTTIWKGVDIQSPEFSWAPGDEYYYSCWASSKEEAESKSAEHLAFKYGI